MLIDWVRFAGSKRGLRGELVDETLAAVDEWASELRRGIDDPRAWGPAKTFVAAMVEAGVDLSDEEAVGRYIDQANEAAVWGSTELAGPAASVATSVVEAAPFSWAGIPTDLRPRVGDIVAVCDRVSAEVLDAEYCELARRLVAKLARKRPSPLARGDTTIWAGGVLYALGQHNWLFYRSAPMHLPGKDLARAVGLSQASIAQKAKLVKAVGGLGPNDSEFRRAEINARGPLASLYRYGF